MTDEHDVQSQTANGKRVRKGYLLAKSEEITHFIDRLLGEVWSVPSESELGLRYTVYRDHNGWKCQCPDNRLLGSTCKHIHAVRFWMALKRSRENPRLFSPYEGAEVNRCKSCKSTTIIKYGKPRGKQNYFCNTCESKFVPDDGFRKMKYDPIIITACLDLYFKKATFREIADHLYQIYGIKISHVSVLNWIKRYVSIISKSIKDLAPILPTTWNADETVVKFGGEYKWIWNVLDKESRFLLASVVSETRNTGDARRTFAKAKLVAKDKPLVVITDGFQPYVEAAKKEFYTLKNPKTKHIGNAGIRGKINNNVIERYHGTFKAKNKTQRGLKKTTPPTVVGQVIAYNYTRPHQALDGMTPAEVAGIDLDLGQNKWLGLIKKAKQKEATVNDFAKDDAEKNLCPEIGSEPNDVKTEQLPIKADNNPTEKPQPNLEDVKTEIREQADQAPKRSDNEDGQFVSLKTTRNIMERWKKNGWLASE